MEIKLKGGDEQDYLTPWRKFIGGSATYAKKTYRKRCRKVWKSMVRDKFSEYLEDAKIDEF